VFASQRHRLQWCQSKPFDCLARFGVPSRFGVLRTLCADKHLIFTGSPTWRALQERHAEPAGYSIDSIDGAVPLTYVLIRCLRSCLLDFIRRQILTFTSRGVGETGRVRPGPIEDRCSAAVLLPSVGPIRECRLCSTGKSHGLNWRQSCAAMIRFAEIDVPLHRPPGTRLAQENMLRPIIIWTDSWVIPLSRAGVDHQVFVRNRSGAV
jgi:hypothetical protein